MTTNYKKGLMKSEFLMILAIIWLLILFVLAFRRDSTKTEWTTVCKGSPTTYVDGIYTKEIEHESNMMVIGDPTITPVTPEKLAEIRPVTDGEFKAMQETWARNYQKRWGISKEQADCEVKSICYKLIKMNY